MLGPVYALKQIKSNILANLDLSNTATKLLNITSRQLMRTQNNPELNVKSGVII